MKTKYPELLSSSKVGDPLRVTFSHEKMGVTGSVSPLHVQVVDYSGGTNVDVFCVQEHMTMFELNADLSSGGNPIVVGGEHTVTPKYKLSFNGAKTK